MGAIGVGEAFERQRDLRGQVAEMERLTSGEQTEVIFIANAPGREPIMIYSLTDGEPIPVPKYMVQAALSKMENGQYLFTARKEDAPDYQLGDVKCFLHPESIERQSGMLDAAGLAGFVCMSAHHPSRYAMEEVARGKHRKQWEALERSRTAQREEENQRRQQQQIDATLALAEKAAGRKGKDAD